MNKKAIEEALLIAEAQSNLKHQMVVVHTIKDLCRRLTEADQVIDQRNAMLSDFWKQEPVMWVMPDGKIVDKHGLGFYKGTNQNDRTPLYTTPPAAQRPVPEERKWVGLTDDEVTICHSLAVLSKKHDGTDPSFTTLLHRQIEAKLREKNNG